MNANAPQPRGITGLRPGIATNSLAAGGGVCGGDNNDVMNAIIINNPTISMENIHTHRETSP